LRMKRSLLVQSSFTFLNPLQPSGTTLNCEGGSLGGLTVVTGFFLQPRFRLLQHHLFFFLLHSSLVMQLNRGLGLVVDVVVGVVVGMVVTGTMGVTFNGAGVVTGFKGGKTGGKTGTMGGVVVLG